MSTIHRLPPASQGEETEKFVTLRLGGQLIGLPIAQVKDVFQVRGITPVPLSDPSVLGLMNLRGRIVVVFSLAGLLQVERRPPGKLSLAVGVNWRGETYGIETDSIGDVLELPASRSEVPPGTLAGPWARHARRVHRLDDELMIELDVNSLLDMPLVMAA